MESEEESVRWFLDNFQDDRIVAFVLVFSEAVGVRICSSSPFQSKLPPLVAT